MTVPCGQRTELRLKIVSSVYKKDQIAWNWNRHKEKVGGHEQLHLDPESLKLHLDPANPFAYVLVVRAFRGGEPVSAELVLGPFEFFNNDTSAVR